MVYRICKSFEIENGHQLSKHPGKCRFPHGHSRRVELVVESSDLDGNEMVCDFKVFKELVGDFLDGYDHALCMNTQDLKYADMKETYGDRVIGFEGIDPTTEVMARVICETLEARLRERAGREGRYAVRSSLRVVGVRVWETSSSWAEFLP